MERGFSTTPLPSSSPILHPSDHSDSSPPSESSSFKSLDSSSTFIQNQLFSTEMASTSALAAPSNSMGNQPNYTTIPKLSSGNFHVWKLRLETFLGAMKLRPYILPDMTIPTDAASLDDYITKDCAALNAIHSTIDEKNMEIVTSPTTAIEAYLALSQHHGDSGGMTTATMFFELVTMKLIPGGSVAEHVHKFRTLHNQFKANTRSMKNITISDHYIAILLLKSLPTEYNSLVQTTLTTNFENISLSHIYMLLSMETMRIKSSSDNSAMIAQNVTKSKPSKAPKQPPVCSLGHPGHSDERCYTRIRKEERELANKYCEMIKKNGETAQLTSTRTANQTPSSINNAPVAPSYYDEAYAVGTQDLLFVTLDTGCTSHMFGNRQYLSRMRQIPPSPIHVASKSGDIYAKEKGTAHIGRFRLENLIHSPELAANLILAGMLYDKGYNIKWNARTAEVISTDGSVLLTFYRDPKTPGSGKSR